MRQLLIGEVRAHVLKNRVRHKSIGEHGDRFGPRQRGAFPVRVEPCVPLWGNAAGKINDT